jgi:hypothetical protein
MSLISAITYPVVIDLLEIDFSPSYDFDSLVLQSECHEGYYGLLQVRPDDARLVGSASYCTSGLECHD